jgi:hypothetical protein
MPWCERLSPLVSMRTAEGVTDGGVITRLDFPLKRRI